LEALGLSIRNQSASATNTNLRYDKAVAAGAYAWIVGSAVGGCRTDRIVNSANVFDSDLCVKITDSVGDSAC